MTRNPWLNLCFARHKSTLIVSQETSECDAISVSSTRENKSDTSNRRGVFSRKCTHGRSYLTGDFLRVLDIYPDEPFARWVVVRSYDSSGKHSDPRAIAAYVSLFGLWLLLQQKKSTVSFLSSFLLEMYLLIKPMNFISWDFINRWNHGKCKSETKNSHS